MKRTGLLRFLLCLSLVLCGRLFGEQTPPLAEPHPEQFHSQQPPTGTLGLPLGTFAVIEGTGHAAGLVSGYGDFIAEIVNGRRLKTPVPLELSGQRENVKPGIHYTLHGYETGRWHPGDINAAPSEVYPFSPRIQFIFETEFVVTSIEKEGGATVPGAKPLDPKFPLAAPKLDATFTWDQKPPMGSLGLPLGSYAVVEGIDHPYGMGRDRRGFEIRKVNGKKLDPPRYLPIYGFPLVDGKRYVLDGYETGEWGGKPTLPKGERLGEQVSFGFFPRFVAISIKKVDGVDAKPPDPGPSLRQP